MAVTSEAENPDPKLLRHAGSVYNEYRMCLCLIFIHDQSVTRGDHDGTLLVLPDNYVDVT